MLMCVVVYVVAGGVSAVAVVVVAFVIAVVVAVVVVDAVVSSCSISVYKKYQPVSRFVSSSKCNDSRYISSVSLAAFSNVL